MTKEVITREIKTKSAKITIKEWHLIDGKIETKEVDDETFYNVLNDYPSMFNEDMCLHYFYDNKMYLICVDEYKEDFKFGKVK